MNGFLIFNSLTDNLDFNSLAIAIGSVLTGFKDSTLLQALPRADMNVR